MGEVAGVPLSFTDAYALEDGVCLFTAAAENTELGANCKVIGFYGMSREITERKQMQDQVRELAFYDPLTKLPNRHLLNDRLNQTMAASKSKQHYGAPKELWSVIS